MSEPRATEDASRSLPKYDESEWPIFRVTMPPVALSEAAFQAHLDACSERYKRGQPFCMLIDMGEQPPLGAVRRKAVADRMTEDGQRFPSVMLGCALVVQSAPSRGGDSSHSETCEKPGSGWSRCSSTIEWPCAHGRPLRRARPRLDEVVAVGHRPPWGPPGATVERWCVVTRRKA
jgi:hypothetical protein